MASRSSLITRPIVAAQEALMRLLKAEAFGGLLLLACTLVALFCVNSSIGEAYASWWLKPIHLGLGDWSLTKDIQLFVNDGLMTLFFFVVGLEIKKECTSGELQRLRSAALPAISALGGMIIPALFYRLAVPEGPGARGWGIPMATDIAFVVGLLSLLGDRVPKGLKVWLLTLAIVDDIGAVLVIAVFYTQGLAYVPLALAGAGFVAIFAAEKAGVRSTGIYTLLGFAIWFAVLKSGVHPTIAGVLLGLMTPAKALYPDHKSSLKGLREALRIFETQKSKASAALEKVSEVALESLAPLERLAHSLEPWNRYLVLPLFALANAGVVLSAADGAQDIRNGVLLGLLIGKPLGVLGLSYLAVRLNVAELPRGVSWKVLAAASLLTGVGFTMSIFIAGLALDSSLLGQGKIGTLEASAISASLGLLGLLLVLPKQKPKPTVVLFKR